MKIKRHNFFSINLLLVFLVISSALACRLVTGIPDRLQQQQVPATPILAPTVSPSSVPIPAPTRTAPSNLQISPSLQPESVSPQSLPAVNLTEFQVHFHPDDFLVVGDQVSIEVIPPPELDFDNFKLQAALQDGPSIGEVEFSHFGIAGRQQATLTWAWDTRGLEPGEVQLQFTIQPGGVSWIETVNLLPSDALPAQLRDASWAQANSDCCVIHYVTGTAAERDLDSLLGKIDFQAQDVENRFGIKFSEPVTITLLSRLLGHGGFASNEIHVSYLDRDYSAGSPEMVIHHEMVHILDARLGGDFRPSLFIEGLAVYLTGGHFKPESLMPRAAALLDSWGTPQQPGLGWYIPLEQLADDFYASQHEIGYLQAAALVEFMLDRYGWDAFMDFYRTIEPGSEGQASAIDSALRAHFDLSLADLEWDFLAALHLLSADPDLAVDVRLTVQFYDTVRNYQQKLDPSAYFLTAWLVDTATMRREGIVADYLRHPDNRINLTLETMLAAAGEDIHSEQYRAAEMIIMAVNAVMQAQESGWPDPFAASLVASEYYDLVQVVAENPDWVEAVPGVWIEPQRIWIDGSRASVWLTAGDAQLLEAHLGRDPSGSWQLIDFVVLSSTQFPENRKNPNSLTYWGFQSAKWFVGEYLGYGKQ